MASLDVGDVRLEYIAYLEEEGDFLEGRLIAEDILFSFLFAPLSRQSAACPILQSQTDVVHTGLRDSRAVSANAGQFLAETA